MTKIQDTLPESQIDMSDFLKEQDEAVNLGEPFDPEQHIKRSNSTKLAERKVNPTKAA